MITLKVFDLTSSDVDHECMPLCPLCDQPVMDYEPAAIGTAAGAKCLVHEDCAEAGQ